MHVGALSSSHTAPTMPRHTLATVDIPRRVFRPRGRIDWRFVSCDIGMRKPSPEAFDYVLRDLGCDLQRDVVCFVDDSKTNVAAGNAAGMRSILFEGDSAECRTALIAEGFWELRV